MTVFGSGIPARLKGHEVSIRHPDFNPMDPAQLELVKVAAQQYRDYAPTAEKLVRSRVRSNWLFLRIHMASVAGIALFLKVGVTPSRADVLNVGALGLVVMLLVNITWAWTILSITRQAERKYRVIESLESFLPVRPHTAEWELAGRGKKLLSHLPRWVAELGMPLLMSLVWLGAYGVVWLR
jgi:hypothetical protein